MPKKYIVICIALCTALGLFAYNPPAGGENMYSLSSPAMLGGQSASGGPFMASPSESIILNPALTGGVQRVMLDLSGTFLSSFGQGEDGAGGAFHAGMVIPSRWGVFTGAVEGVFSDFAAMPLGNTFTIRAGFAKDISDTFYVGAALDGGFGTSWALNLSVGVWQRLGKVGFMKDARWGLSLTGMGKPFTTTAAGINGSAADWYPSFFTPHIGAGATLVSLGAFEMGGALDLSLPAFQNAVLDAALAFRLFERLNISTNWNFNLREVLNQKYSLIPSVAVSFIFNVTGKKDSFLDKKGWQKSEIVPQVAYRQLYSGINAVSGGLSMALGLKDTEAPVIKVGGQDE